MLMASESWFGLQQRRARIGHDTATEVIANLVLRLVVQRVDERFAKPLSSSSTVSGMTLKRKYPSYTSNRGNQRSVNAIRLINLK